ncbi:hypothetical protein HHUSO_G36858 [Huso huso]|uniref:Uncharacterized protein n=1 Tax=Huso huso TaxID=61971 RepID=A0ABR0Y0W0_HUSHU
MRLVFSVITLAACLEISLTAFLSRHAGLPDYDVTEGLDSTELGVWDLISLQCGQGGGGSGGPRERDRRSPARWDSDPGREKRRLRQDGYNLNSFGLRFGKRDTKFNWNSFGLRFGRKREEGELQTARKAMNPT